MHLAGRAGFDHQAGAGTQAGIDQMMMHGGGRQQRRDGDVIGIDRAVGQNQNIAALAHRLFGAGAQRFKRSCHAGRTLIGGVADAEGLGAEAAVGVLGDAADFFHVGVRQHRLLHFETLERFALVEAEQVRARAENGDQRHHQLLADRIDGRVGDLREGLLEIVVERLGPIGQHRQRRVVAHRTGGFFTAHRHGRENELDVFLAVTEGLLTIQQTARHRNRRSLGRQVLEHDLGVRQPLVIRPRGGELALQFAVVDDAALLQIDQEHLAGLQAPLLDDLVLRNIEHAHLGGHHHQIVIGDQITRRPQTVAIERGADLPTVGERDGGGTVPRLHQRGMVFVEGAARLVHQRIAGPGLGDQQHHGVRQRVTAGHQQFQRIVETGGIGLAFDDQWPELVEIVAEQLG